MWEGVRDRTELQYIDPHSYSRQRCVFLVLQGCSTGSPGAQLSAGWWLSLLHLISNFSGPQLIRARSAPLAWRGFPYYTCLYNSNSLWLLVLTELYNSSTPTQSLEWHVWSSLSGNNCHAVHGSLSSVYECTMVFFLLCPISSAKSRLCDFFRLLAIEMCHFLPVHHFGMAYWPGQRSKHNTLDQHFLPRGSYLITPQMMASTMSFPWIVNAYYLTTFGCLVWFYGIWTIVGYLIPNPFFYINSSISNNSV